jgi:hypothetical protein
MSRERVSVVRVWDGARAMIPTMGLIMALRCGSDFLASPNEDEHEREETKRECDKE